VVSHRDRTQFRSPEADPLAWMAVADQNSGASRAPHHRLWWAPGVCGKGILYHSGMVCTWPEEEAHHRVMSELHLERAGERARLFFLVDPDGRVHLYIRDGAEAAELAALLRSADGRLELITPEPAGRAAVPVPSAATPRASEQRRAEWLMWQRRGAAIA
jgi:hypothetical protein